MNGLFVFNRWTARSNALSFTESFCSLSPKDDSTGLSHSHSHKTRGTEERGIQFFATYVHVGRLPDFARIDYVTDVMTDVVLDFHISAGYVKSPETNETA